MANSDVIITEASKYQFARLDQHKQLAMLALAMYCTENGANSSSTAATLKTYLQTAKSALAGIPEKSFLPVLIAEYWTVVNTAATSDLVNASNATKDKCVANAYLNSLSDLELKRLILYLNGKIASVLT